MLVYIIPWNWEIWEWIMKTVQANQTSGKFKDLKQADKY